MSAFFATVSYFELNITMSAQQQVLFLSNVGILVLFAQGGLFRRALARRASFLTRAAPVPF